MTERCIHCGGVPDRDREGNVIRWIIGYPGITMPTHRHELPES